MEFRVFLPVLKSNPFLGASSSIFDKYMLGVTQIRDSRRDSAFESRTDIYIGGSNSFGLKYRNEDKLELKVLQNVLSAIPGIETYVKEKLGKTKIDDPKFVKKVMRVLEELGNADVANNAL